MKEALNSPLCKQCGREFNSKTVWQKFCSSKCNRKWWNDNHNRKNVEKICIICGSSFIVPKGNWKTCSEVCKQKRLDYVRSTEYKNQHTDFNNKRRKNTEYIIKRLKQDNSFRILFRLRQRIRGALFKKKKIDVSLNLIGCTITQLKRHLQNTAIENGYIDFNIENYNSKEYHIDHIIPCASFDLTKEEEQIKCFNYTNLQILEAKINLSKGCKIYG